MKVEQKQEKECSACTKPTKYICINCATDKGKFIALCLDPQCVRIHDRLVHSDGVAANV